MISTSSRGSSLDTRTLEFQMFSKCPKFISLNGVQCSTWTSTHLPHSHESKTRFPNPANCSAMEDSDPQRTSPKHGSMEQAVKHKPPSSSDRVHQIITSISKIVSDQTSDQTSDQIQIKFKSKFPAIKQK